MLQVSQFVLHHALLHKQYGKALKVLQKQTEEKKTIDNDKQTIDVSVYTDKYIEEAGVCVCVCVCVRACVCVT